MAPGLASALAHGPCSMVHALTWQVTIHALPFISASCTSLAPADTALLRLTSPGPAPRHSPARPSLATTCRATAQGLAADRPASACRRTWGAYQGRGEGEDNGARGEQRVQGQPKCCSWHACQLLLPHAT
jgi:hypothetical protein